MTFTVANRALTAISLVRIAAIGAVVLASRSLIARPLLVARAVVAMAARGLGAAASLAAQGAMAVLLWLLGAQGEATLRLPPFYVPRIIFDASLDREVRFDARLDLVLRFDDARLDRTEHLDARLG
jgi:hypothetical protein